MMVNNKEDLFKFCGVHDDWDFFRKTKEYKGYSDTIYKSSNYSSEIDNCVTIYGSREVSPNEFSLTFKFPFIIEQATFHEWMIEIHRKQIEHERQRLDKVEDKLLRGVLFT